MKFIRIFLLVLIIIGLGLLATQKYWVPPFVQWIIDTENKDSLIQNQVSVKSLDNQKNDTFDTLDINPSSIKNFNNETPIVFLSPNGIQISFSGTVEQARNPGSNVYLNQNKIGTVEGKGVIDGSFIEDNSKFLFSVISICGVDCVNKYDYEIDIVSSKLILKK